MRSAWKNAIFVVLIVLANTTGNLSLALGMNHMPDILATPISDYLFDVLRNAWLFAGTLLLIVSTLAQLSMYTWADLSYVLPLTASGYVVTAFLSRFVIGEQVSAARWVGVALISLGVLFVARTPAATKPHEGAR